MNPSKRHRPMVMRVRYGTPAICTAVAPPERRECAQMSSRENQSLAAPTQRVSTLMTEIMFEVLTEGIP